MQSIRAWDIFVRFFHWTLVGSMIGMVISGEEWQGLHVRLGYLVILLVLARIVWGFIGTKHARFRDFLYTPTEIYKYLKSLTTGRPIHYTGHNPAGGLMILVMLIALLATTFTGLKALAAEGKGPLAKSAISVVGTAFADEEISGHEGGRRPSGSHSGEGKEEIWEEIHEGMTGFMIVLVVVHIGGVIVSSWLHKENLVLSMITGKKRFAPPHSE